MTTKHYEIDSTRLAVALAGHNPRDPYPSDDRLFWSVIIFCTIFGAVAGAVAWFV